LFKVGFGYDSHRFTAERSLVLGGIKITDEYGLDGHSDADVLLHALIDALLGAAGSGDIGSHFPDDDPQYKNISSSILLKETVPELKTKGYSINNCDLTVVAEKPKLKKFRNKIVDSLADKLDLEKVNINFKATTNEKMGFVGREEGMAAYAVVSIIKSELRHVFVNFLEREGRKYDVS